MNTDKQNANNDNIIFRHGTTATKQRFTMAASQKNEDTVAVTVALCSENNSFSKKRGRVISSGRLIKGKRIRTYVLDDKKDIKENINNLFDDIQGQSKTAIISHFGFAQYGEKRNIK